MNKQTWDEIVNEGNTDGYNPYRSGDDNEPLWSKVESRISKLQRLLNGMSFDDHRRTSREAELTRLQTIYATLDQS